MDIDTFSSDPTVVVVESPSSQWSAALVLLSCAVFLGGCKPADTTEKSQGATPAQGAASNPVTKPASGAALSPADQAWAAILADAEPPSFPATWESNPPSRKDIDAFLFDMSRKALEAADRARDFHTRFTNDAKATEARLREHRQLGVAVQFGQTNQLARLQQVVASFPPLPRMEEGERFFMRSGVAHRLNYLAGSSYGLVDLDTFELELRFLQREFAALDEFNDLLMELAKARLENDDIERARKIAVEFQTSKASAAYKESAAGLLKRIERIGKPLSFEFKSHTGRDFDTAKLKGQVVLLDFWATWCAPCMAEMPRVRRIYSTYHEKGFEIIGLSFDEDKAALEKVLASEKMSWPQHFDGKGFESRFSSEFDITSIPTMWLIDKKGILRDINGRKDLEEKVKKLLAE